MGTVEEFIKRKTEQFKKNPVVNAKDIGRQGKHRFIREAWTFMPQHNLNKKVFIVERLKKETFDGEIAYKESWSKGDIEYRIGYYIIGRIGRAKDKWVWGQFCPLIPQEDFEKLIQKAKQEKTIL